MNQSEICSVSNCGRSIYSRGLCSRCYQRIRKLKGANFKILRSKFCLAEECGRLAVSRSYCALHYQRLMRNGSIDLPGEFADREASKFRTIARNLKKEGWTYQRIADCMEISRQRAQQLVSPTDKHVVYLRNELGNACQICGRSDCKLDLHHEDYSSEPSMLLCARCHRNNHNRTLEMKIV